MIYYFSECCFQVSVVRSSNIYLCQEVTFKIQQLNNDLPPPRRTSCLSLDSPPHFQCLTCLVLPLAHLQVLWWKFNYKIIHILSSLSINGLSHCLLYMTKLRGRPLDIQGGARNIRWREILYFTSRRRENIFFSLPRRQNISSNILCNGRYTGSLGANIFFTTVEEEFIYFTIFEEEFIYFRILPSPPPGYLMVAP